MYCLSRNFTSDNFAFQYKTYRIKDQQGAELKFIFNDVMGLEDTGDGGALPADIVNALKGHIREGYEVQGNKSRETYLCLCVLYLKYMNS